MSEGSLARFQIFEPTAKELDNNINITSHHRQNLLHETRSNATAATTNNFSILLDIERTLLTVKRICSTLQQKNSTATATTRHHIGRASFNDQGAAPLHTTTTPIPFYSTTRAAIMAHNPYAVSASSRPQYPSSSASTHRQQSSAARQVTPPAVMTCNKCQKPLTATVLLYRCNCLICEGE